MWLIAQIIFGQNIQQGNDGSIQINGAGAVFSALSFPAYISMGVLFTVTGIDPKVDHTITAYVKAEDEDEERIVVQGNIAGDPYSADNEFPSIVNTMDLRQVPIIKEGTQHFIIKIDDEVAISSPFKVVLKSVI